MHHDSDSLDSINTDIKNKRISFALELRKLTFQRSQSIKTTEDTTKRWSRAQIKLLINIQTKVNI